MEPAEPSVAISDARRRAGSIALFLALSSRVIAGNLQECRRLLRTGISRGRECPGESPSVRANRRVTPRGHQTSTLYRGPTVGDSPCCRPERVLPGRQLRAEPPNTPGILSAAARPVPRAAMCYTSDFQRFFADHQWSRVDIGRRSCYGSNLVWEPPEQVSVSRHWRNAPA